MDLREFSKAISKAPEIKHLIINQRLKGKTPTYLVQNYWAINIYDCKGKVIFPESGREWNFDKGSFCFIPPNIQRRFFFEKAGTQRVIHFVFGNKNSNLENGVCFNTHLSYRKINTLFDEMMSRNHKSGTSNVPQFWYLLSLVENLLDKENTTSSKHHPAIDRSKVYIEKHLNTNIQVNDIVKHSHVSHNYLTRLFKQSFDKTIASYLNQRKMEVARELIQQTNLSIKSIAAELGYLNLQHFNKLVRRAYGYSPRALRDLKSKAE